MQYMENKPRNHDSDKSLRTYFLGPEDPFIMVSLICSMRSMADKPGAK